MNNSLENLYLDAFGYIRDISYFKDIIKIYDENNIIIGSVGIEKDYNDIIVLTALCVLKKYRNNGVATRILNIIYEKYKNIPIFLYIDKDNKNYEYLVNFYNKRGFISLYNINNLPININYNPDIELLLYNKNE